ncbi:SGNH/GDSL hydrolase family protein [Gordonia rubripertincta]|uniref:SGNH/GDSL hydrolase family protein n=1 Tax=Gordonia rubripertincta TaxID=36822 RepID=UPI00117E3DDA|nr:SGNH/GDSL hydrolase family protein [Gordonia rubripertincta]TSD93389.1 SGNH/GDSL hydrolase family protein [Gordonia rubripertincta]
MRLHRRSATLVLALASVAGLVAGATAVAVADDPTEYVALGASFSAGVGIPSPVPGSPSGCGRSTNNFPRLVAEAEGYRLKDMSCGGAQTRHLTTSQTAGQPPQFDGLSSTTDVVTMQIGYNDGNVYSGSIADCSQTASGSSQLAPCEARTLGRYSAEIQVTAANIAAAIAGVKDRAPSARILVVGYPAVYPQQGNCPGRNPFSAPDTAFLDRLEVELNTMLKTQAQSAGVDFVDTYGPSVGHDSCKPQSTRWVEPYTNPIGALRLHPNAKGHQQVAKAVLAALD